MITSQRIVQAISLAAHLHRNQTRRDHNKTPYISHLVSVAMLLRDVTEDEDIIIAGIMHDSLEDVPGYTIERLKEDCGDRVADIVYHVTEPLDADKESVDQLPWLQRKQLYLERLREGGEASALVSCADKVHNAESFFQGMQEEGDQFTKQFFGSLKNMAWFHREVFAVVKEKIDENNPLLQRFESTTNKFATLLTESESH
jgi:(p)ppGpp synthase/HD superfamily hydrolase